LLMAVVLLLPLGRLSAQSSADPDGGLAGFKDRLARRGIRPGWTYLGEVFSDAAGGLRRGAVDLHNVSLTLSFDLGKLAGWRGATLFLYGMGIAGGSPERYIGDIQGVSNIAAPNAVRLYEAWIQQNLWGGRLSFLAGIYDLNSEFDILEPASVFLSASQGIDPTFAFSGLNGPSVFPFTTLAFRSRLKLGGFYLRAAVVNGLAGDPSDPDATRIIVRERYGVLLAAEAGYHIPLTLRRHREQAVRRSVRRYVAPAYAGKIAFGVWDYTAGFEPLLPGPDEPPTRHGNAGLYGLLSHTLWRTDGEEGRRLMAFARVGLANPRFNRLGLFAGGGLSFTGLFPGRPKDIAGLAFAAAFNGNDFMRKASLDGVPVRRAEWDLELTYQARLLRWLDLHPDIQFVIHPGQAPAVRSALGFDLRLEIEI
jgi:porin